MSIRGQSAGRRVAASVAVAVAIASGTACGGSVSTDQGRNVSSSTGHFTYKVPSGFLVSRDATSGAPHWVANATGVFDPSSGAAIFVGNEPLPQSAVGVVPIKLEMSYMAQMRALWRASRAPFRHLTISNRPTLEYEVGSAVAGRRDTTLHSYVIFRSKDLVHIDCEATTEAGRDVARRGCASVAKSLAF
jgi:hypothetical protein